jgi:hypothetical protein
MTIIGIGWNGKKKMPDKLQYNGKERKMFHFTLARGHDVSVKCLYCESNYNYLLIGSPIKPINDQIMKNAVALNLCND